MGYTLRQLKEMGIDFEVAGGDPKAKEPRGRPEEEFQKAVIKYAQLRGWRVAHFRPALTADGRWITPVAADGKGFLDLLMVRERLVVAELKAGDNKLTKEQTEWFKAWQRVKAECYVWYPKDLDNIHRILE